MTDRRLLFVCSTLAIGGFERHLSELVPGLRDRGFTPVVLALRHRGAMFEELRRIGVEMRFADMRSRSDLRGMRRALVAAEQPDVVISQSIDAHLVAGRIARRAGVPHVTVEHAAPELLADRRLHHRIAYRWVAPRVARVVALSRTQIPGLIGLRYREDSIRVIPNGVREPHPGRPVSEVRAELGLGERDFVVALVATLRPEKRAQWFVEAVIEASRVEPSVKGLVIGAGPHLERVRTAVRRAPGVVQALGERSDVSDLVAASDAAGLSSRAECLPLAVLEAMALARPTVATDVGGMRDLVVHGETGLLVSPDDPAALSAAIVQLARNRGPAAEMGLSARRRYERAYTTEVMIDAYCELFDEFARDGLGLLAAG